MKSLSSKTISRIRRRNRIRSKVSGTSDRPRLAVFKSNTSIFVQIINDADGKTIVSAHSREVKGKGMKEKSVLVGKMIAEKAKAKKVKSVVFDRGGFIYTGNIKALADAAREGGLEF